MCGVGRLFPAQEDFLEILGEHYEFGAMIDFGALGGDQQVSTQIVVQAVGCIIYFGDPVNMTPYHSDTEALERLINVTNIIYASNPTTAVALMEVLGEGVRGKPELMPSMFTKLESPAVEEYAKQQKAIVEQMKARAGGGGPAGSSTKDLQGFDAGKMKASAESRVAHHMKNAVRAVQLIERVNFHLHTSGDATVSLLGAEKPATPEKRSGPPSSARMEIDAKDMRCLALISHNHMKPAMQDFVVQNKEVLRKFRLTGTNSTMTMLRSVLGEDANFGPGCASGPLGGDAQVGAQLCLSDIGGVIFFTDPLSAHPHMADVLALVRLVNVKNVLHATNTATATALIQLLGKALHGYPELIPSFFKDLASPAIGAGHENEDEKEFNRLENDRMSDGGPQRPVLEQEKLPSIAELRTSRRSEAATPGSAKALLSANALGIAKTLDSTPPPTPPPASLPPTVDDSTTKALLIGAAVVVGTTMMMTVGGLTIVGVMLLRSKK